MKTVGVAELKNKLSHYLDGVRNRGEEILIRDRNRPIAKIIPLTGADEFTEEELALAAAGILRLPENPNPPKDLLKEKRANVSLKDAIKAVSDERGENLY